MGKKNKRKRRSKFEERHLDQIWSDLKTKTILFKNNKGPVGTTDKVELDEDITAYGKYYCKPCSKYFASMGTLSDHKKHKKHKRRVKQLEKNKNLHNQHEADLAGGLSSPDNGNKIDMLDKDLSKVNL